MGVSNQPKKSQQQVQLANVLRETDSGHVRKTILRDNIFVLFQRELLFCDLMYLPPLLFRPSVSVYFSLKTLDSVLSVLN